MVYTEATPNPGTMKFVANKMLLPHYAADFPDEEAARESPLASELFGFPFVRGVFISNNYVTITKSDDITWHEVIPELREYLREYIASQQPVVSDALMEKLEASRPQTDDSTEQQVIELLDKYVKPAVEMDGGAIRFKSYHAGVVTVELQGACSGCPSASLTLKNGIEAMLKRMIPGIKEVVAEEL